jgi:hypothetical protein
VTYTPTGVILQVTPKISPDGTIIMRIDPSISTVIQGTIQISAGVLAPIFNVTRASTTVSTTDGQTVVIGGLIERDDTKNETKAPWLGDLPYLGALFRYRTYTKTKHELLILLTPQIIRSPCDPNVARILAEETTRMDWQFRDVHYVHRPLEVEPLLPVYPKAPALPLPPHGSPDVPWLFQTDPAEALPPPRKAEPSQPEGPSPGTLPALPQGVGTRPPERTVPMPKG